MKNTLNQSWFFQLVRNEIEPQLSLPDFLFELFGWSKPTVYKKIRGERTLKMEEFFAIIGELPHLAMSIGEVYKANDLKLVQMHSVSTLVHFQKYLEGIESLFLQLTSDPNHSMLYAASDIPIMYYFQFPELLRYKWAFWSNQAAPHQALPILPPAVLKSAQRIYHLYSSIHSKELWQINALKAQLDKLSYRSEEHLVPKDQFSLLHQQFLNIETQMVQATRNGQKEKGGRFEARIRPDLSLNNSGYLHFHDKQILASSYSSLNFLRSRSEKSCNNFLNHWEKQWNTGVSLSLPHHPYLEVFLRKV
jgi:hypothetical protein